MTANTDESFELTHSSGRVVGNLNRRARIYTVCIQGQSSFDENGDGGGGQMSIEN
jgi:hypothetical protein